MSLDQVTEPEPVAQSHGFAVAELQLELDTESTCVVEEKKVVKREYTLGLNGAAAHSSQIWQTTFHPTLPLMASCSQDGSVWLWNTETTPWTKQQQLKASCGGYAYDVAFSPDGTRLASAQYNGCAVSIWKGSCDDAKTQWTHERNLRDPSSQNPCSVAWSHDENRLAFGNHGGRIHIFNTTSWQNERTLAWSGQVRQLQFSADDDQLICSNNNGSANMSVWSCSTWQQIQQLSGHSGSIHSLSMVTVESKSEQCQYLASGCTGNIVQVWRRDSSSAEWKLQHKLTACNQVYGVALSPDGSVVAATAYNSNSVQIWSVSTGELLDTLAGLPNYTRSISFSPLGDALVTGLQNGTISMWTVSPAFCKATLPLTAFMSDDVEEVHEEVVDAATVESLRCCGLCKEDFFVDIDDDELKRFEAAQRDVQNTIAALIGHDHGPDCDCKHEASLESMAADIVDRDYKTRLAASTGPTTDTTLALVLRSDRIPASVPDKPQHEQLPALLSCGHTLCRACAFKCIQPHTNPRRDTLYGVVKCPMRCKRHSVFVADIGVEWLPLDVSRVRLLQQHQAKLSKRAKASKKRPMCSEHKSTKATFFCTDPVCAEFAFMCDECNKSEHAARNTRNHKRVPASEAHTVSETKKAPQTIICNEHECAVIGMCETDSTLLCQQCMSAHSSHNSFLFRDASKQWLSDLGELQLDAFLKASRMTDHVSSIEGLFQHLLSECDEQLRCVIQAAKNQHVAATKKLLRWRKTQVEQSKAVANDLSGVASRILCTRSALEHAIQNADCK
jgi:DNA-binding beta-propeller fold protein YncE